MQNMPKMLNLRFRDNFKVLNFCLKLNRCHPDLTHNAGWKLQITIIYVILVINVYTLFYSIITHDLKVGNFGELCKNFTMVIVFVTISSKLIPLIIYQDSIKDMIEFIEKDYNAFTYTDEEQEIVLKYVKKGARIDVIWIILVFGSVSIFPIKAFMAMIQNAWKGEFKLVSMFELVYPEPIESHKNDPVVFWILFLMEFLFGYICGSTYVGFDTIVPICMLHVCGQIIILKRHILQLFKETENPREIEKKLKVMVVKLQSLYKFVDVMKTIFVIVYEFSMKGTTLMMPFTAFQIVEDLRKNSVNIEFLALFLSGSIHFFLPCYYSDLLMDEGEHFCQAIYASGWENCPNKIVRQTILFMMMRANVSMGIKSVFYQINLDTFAEMCRQAYSIFSIMNAAWS